MPSSTRRPSLRHGSPRLTRNRAASARLGAAYDRVADGFSHTYSLMKEEGQYREKSYAIRRALFAEHPDDAVVRRDLRVSQNKLADFRKRTTDFDEARRLYDESLQSLRAEPVSDKNRTEILSDLRFTLSRVAIVASTQVRVSETLAVLRESLALAREAVRDRPSECLLLAPARVCGSIISDRRAWNMGYSMKPKRLLSPFATTAGRPPTPIRPTRIRVAASPWPINILATWPIAVERSMPREPSMSRA